MIEDMTPHEVWTKEKPQVGHLHVSDCERQNLDLIMSKWDMVYRQRVPNL